MNKNNNIIIAVGIGIGTMGLAATLILTLFLADKTAITPIDSPETAVETSVESPIVETPVETVDEGYSFGVKGGPKLTEALALEYEVEARNLIAKFQFTEAAEYLDRELGVYDVKDSEAYKTITTMYYDLPVLAQLPYLLEYGEYENINSLIHTFQDPENYLIAVLWLDMEARKPFIATSGSINPVFYGDITVTGRKLVDMPEIEAQYAWTFDVAEITFMIEGNTLVAHVVYTSEGIVIHDILEQTEGSTLYYTVDEWNEIFSDIKRKDTVIEEPVQTTSEEEGN